MAATMTIDEAAEKMHVHNNTVLRLLATGELPGAKIGRAWVILESDVDAYLSAQVKKQTQRRREMALAA